MTDVRSSGAARPLGRATRVALGVLLLGALTAPIFVQLGRWPLVDPDEGRNAEVAREMLAAGRWIVPHFNGLPFLDKPPLLFWTIAAAFRVLGTSELAARLPSALSGVAMVLLTLALGRALLDGRRGLWAAVVVATSPLVLIFSRLVIFDMTFTALVTLALYALVRARLSGLPGRWLALAGLAMGLAVLTKGPVGIVLPLLAWLAARGALPSPAQPPRWRDWLTALLVVLVLVGPWLVAVTRAEPGFLHYALFDETLLRFTSPARFNRGGPFYYPLIVAGSGLGVWGAVLLAVGPSMARRAPWSGQEQTTIRFAARAAGAMLLFFALCASKRPGYVLPALVPLALLTAVGLTVAGRTAAAALRVVAVAAVVSGVAVLAAAGLDLPRIVGLDLGEASSALTPATIVAGAIALLVWGTVVLAGRHVARVAPLMLAATFAPLLYLALLGPLESYAAGRSARELARIVPAGAELLSFRHFRTGLPFYRRAEIPLASFDGHELTSNYVTSTSGPLLAAGRLMSPAAGRETFSASGSRYLLTDASCLKRLARSRRGPFSIVWADRRSVLLATND